MSRQQGTCRLTLDLNKDQHRKLKAWVQQAADSIGAADVPVAVVLRRLVATLIVDPSDEDHDLLARELQRAVLAHLRAEHASPQIDS